MNKDIGGVGFNGFTRFKTGKKARCGDLLWRSLLRRSAAERG
jgi:hypothetical protein